MGLDWRRLLGKPAEASSHGVYDLLFGDVPIARWGATATGSPWDLFAGAKRAMDLGHLDVAKGALRDVLALPGLESRHYLQAWHALLMLGERPAGAEAKRVLGVVAEVPVESGLDVLAAYEDRTARFFHHTGAAIVVETPVPAVTPAVDALLDAARPLVQRIGPSDKPRGGRPEDGRSRLSFLTPSGIHYGEGPLEALMQDPMGGAVVHAATRLMQALMALSTGKPA